MCHPLRVKTIENQIFRVDIPDIASCNCCISAIIIASPRQHEPKEVGIKVKCAIYPIQMQNDMYTGIKAIVQVFLKT